MMNLLREYFDRKHLEKEELPYGTYPVVTFSREYGCPSKLIAQELVEELNKRHQAPSGAHWKFISKEIIEMAAKEMQLKTVDIKYLLSSGNKGLFEDILTSFSPVYVSNAKLKRTLNKVITGLARPGYVVMLGRGSVAILQNFPNSLHVRLQAPIDWRINEISKIKKITKEQAIKVVEETDERRLALIQLFFGRNYDANIFDLILNCHRLSRHEIVEIILMTMQIRKMI